MEENGRALIQGWTIRGRQVVRATKVVSWLQIFVAPSMELALCHPSGQRRTLGAEGQGRKIFPPYFLYLRIVFFTAELKRDK